MGNTKKKSHYTPISQVSNKQYNLRSNTSQPNSNVSKPKHAPYDKNKHKRITRKYNGIETSEYLDESGTFFPDDMDFEDNSNSTFNDNENNEKTSSSSSNSAASQQNVGQGAETNSQDKQVPQPNQDNNKDKPIIPDMENNNEKDNQNQYN